jgi:methyltransferase (TIGR00027 family)
MKEAGTSFNARMIIAILAAEAQKPAGERLFYDPFALRLADAEAITVVRLIERMMPDFRMLIVLRTLYLDQQIEAAVQKGVSQVLFFGSRYETRPLRLPALQQGVKVFEVDHPHDTQWKRQTLPRLCGALPPQVAYVPFDMARDDLLECLRRHGYDPGQHSLFIPDGISSMFAADEADRFFRLVAAVGTAGSALLFSYVHPLLVSGMDYFLEAKQAILGPQATAEPLTFGIDPERIATYLGDRGYHDVVNMAAGQLKKQYFGDDRMPIQDYVALATIGKETAG